MTCQNEIFPSLAWPSIAASECSFQRPFPDSARAEVMSATVASLTPSPAPVCARGTPPPNVCRRDSPTSSNQSQGRAASRRRSRGTGCHDAAAESTDAPAADPEASESSSTVADAAATTVRHASVSRRTALLRASSTVVHTAAASSGVLALHASASAAVPQLAAAAGALDTALTPVAGGALRLSPIGVGTWSWGNQFVWGYDDSMDPELQRVFNTAVTAGVNLFDTADSYGTGNGLDGRSEVLLGKFLRECPSDTAGVQIATKFAPYPWRITPGAITAAAQESAGRLGRFRPSACLLNMPFDTSSWQPASLELTATL